MTTWRPFYWHDLDRSSARVRKLYRAGVTVSLAFAAVAFAAPVAAAVVELLSP